MCNLTLIWNRVDSLCIEAYLCINSWNIVMDDGNLDEKSLGKWQYLKHYRSIIPHKIYKEWQIMLG